jgi:heat-inducible transcriptional repressor
MTNPPGSPLPELDERARAVLKLLIEHYIQDGQPVASRTLARDFGHALSSATIRNVMADLEDAGLIHSPHTSAGRVPTVLGYRFFVDSLIEAPAVGPELIETLKTGFEQKPVTMGQWSAATELLSSITHLAAVVTLPGRDQLSWNRIEFVPLSEHRILVVLLTDDQEVQNRLIETAAPYSRSFLAQAAQFLNEMFVGRNLEAVRQRLVGDLQKTRAGLSDWMKQAMSLAETILAQTLTPTPEVVVSGEVNLMDFDELRDLSRLRDLLDTLARQRDLIRLFDASVRADRVQIYIGSESGYNALSPCSVILSPYRAGGRTLGVLGVIGPTRIPYEKIIPIVQVSADLIGASLQNH